ncbi:MAG: class II glutamine amidotransferase [Butyricicoccaceae bacterium]
MCELFGFSSAKPMTINGWLKEFYTHSSQHPHGWGLALLNGHEVSIEKEPIQATKSRYLKERLKQNITERTVLAHIRYATIGNLEYANCHPYTATDSTGRQWTLIHNGTIFDYPQLSEYISIQQGSTDSERILLYLIDCMNRKTKENGAPLDKRQRFELLDSVVCDMAAGNKLNLMIYDEELLYVHTNYAHSLYFMQQDDVVVITTQPLSRGEWLPVPFTTLLAYSDGALLYTGTEHGQEYIEQPEHLKLLYLAFAQI